MRDHRPGMDPTPRSFLLANHATPVRRPPPRQDDKRAARAKGKAAKVARRRNRGAR